MSSTHKNRVVQKRATSDVYRVDMLDGFRVFQPVSPALLNVTVTDVDVHFRSALIALFVFLKQRSSTVNVHKSALLALIVFARLLQIRTDRPEDAHALRLYLWRNCTLLAVDCSSVNTLLLTDGDG